MLPEDSNRFMMIVVIVAVLIVGVVLWSFDKTATPRQKCSGDCTDQWSGKKDYVCIQKCLDMGIYKDK